MSYGLVYQIDRKMVHRWELREREEKPWKVLRKHNNFSNYLKRAKHKLERRRIRENPEAMSTYGRYGGWEY